MTRNASFKRRVRERMASTGERYGAARRVLLEQATARAADATGGVRPRVSEPEFGDDAIEASTGRRWDEWCDLIEAWPAHAEGHTGVARHLHQTYGLDTWWSQAVTIGWERITGRRLPNQMTDGTFTASVTRTVDVDADELRAALLSEDGRADLFPALETELRSKPTSKALRVAVGDGVALFTLTPKANGRVSINVAHERLATADALEWWKDYWREWLEALDPGD